jgi:hypothetical protein
MKGYPRFFSPLLWVTLASLLTTGLFLAPGALEMRLEWEVTWRLSPGMRTWIAAAHASFAFVVLFMFGALAAVHIRAGFRRRRNRTTGLLLLSAFVVLALTALGIYYPGDEKFGVWASTVHLVVGLLVSLPLGLHVAASRRLHAENRTSRVLPCVRNAHAPLPQETSPHRGLGASR